MLSINVKKYLKEKKEAMDAKNKMIKQIETEELKKAVKKKEAYDLKRIRNNARKKAEWKTGVTKRTGTKKKLLKELMKLNMSKKVSKTCAKGMTKKIKNKKSSHKSKMMDQGINWRDFR